VSDRLLTLASAAAQLGVSQRTVRRLIADETDPLPVVRLGERCRRVNPADLDLWLLRRRAACPAPPGLFAGFSDDARTALESIFCTPTAPEHAETTGAHDPTR
jgi:excisionase family DNA binding protein